MGRSAWLVRGSRDTRFDRWMLTNNYSGVGFNEVEDLSRACDLSQMRNLLYGSIEGQKKGTIDNWAAQLNAFVNRISVGDIVVLPLKNEGLLAFGEVTGDYQHLADGDGLKHVRPVNWIRKDVPRTAIKKDLLYSLGAFSTVCQISRNDAVYRFSQLISGSESDPGSRGKTSLRTTSQVVDPLDVDEVIANDGQDIIRYSRDRILARIREEYAGHDLQELVAEILRAEGMTCKVQRVGADGGIDIIAGSGVLGISAPTIIVQVKSQTSSVGSEVLDQLGGVVGQHQADHGLLVTLGGLTAQARAKVDAQRLRVAVWDSEELLNRLLEHYEVMSEELKRRIPLRRAWLIDESIVN